MLSPERVTDKNGRCSRAPRRGAPAGAAPGRLRGQGGGCAGAVPLVLGGRRLPPARLGPMVEGQASRPGGPERRSQPLRNGMLLVKPRNKT